MDGGRRSLRIERVMSRILIGTSGWSYRSWRGPFFPRQVMIKHHLQFYATQFSTAELNGVFYRTPTVEAVRAWRDGTPDDFIFAWKASKFITHWKRLTEKSRNSLALMETRLRIPAEGRAGSLPAAAAIYRQPRAACRLSEVAQAQAPLCLRISSRELVRDADSRPAARTRHRTMPVRPSRRAGALQVTASFVYVRGHGPGGDIKAAIPTRRCMSGPARSRAGSGSAATSTSISTTTMKSAAPFDALRLMAVLRR